MHCPFCQHTDTRVIDSRVSEDGATIRRRREFEACGQRCSTLETIELKLPAIIKSDGRREQFDARKLRIGFDHPEPDRVIALPPCDPANPYAIPSQFVPYLKAPPGTRTASAQIVYTDGTASPVKVFRR